jgi:hypothetical protein
MRWRLIPWGRVVNLPVTGKERGNPEAVLSLANQSEMRFSRRTRAPRFKGHPRPWVLDCWTLHPAIPANSSLVTQRG